MSSGRSKRFIQTAKKKSASKGAIGSFNQWCRSHNLATDGKVSMKCINKAKQSGDTKLFRKAVFAQNIHGYRSRFGKSLNSPKMNASKYPEGTIKKNTSGVQWIVVNDTWVKVGGKSSHFGVHFDDSEDDAHDSQGYDYDYDYDYGDVTE